MEGKSFTASIAVAGTPLDAFNHITQVSKWWTRDFEGSCAKLGDEFVIYHPGQHYSKQRLTEFIPGKKLVWLVTHSEMSWLDKDKTEWTGTRMIFDLKPRADTTHIHFTHEGLVPGKECYERCTQGWDMVIKNQLAGFISTGKAI